MRVVEQAILATDLALYFRRKDQFLETANKGEIDWQDQDKKDRKSHQPGSSLDPLTLADQDTKDLVLQHFQVEANVGLISSVSLSVSQKFKQWTFDTWQFELKHLVQSIDKILTDRTLF